MPKNFVKNSFWIPIAFLCATQLCYAQAPGSAVENTSSASTALINIGSNSDNNVTMGGEYKQPKNVIEQEKPVCWNWYADIGYWSQYNFRGTNLTPDADGAIFTNASVSKWGFTLGMFFTYQLGTASAPSFSIAEGGGGGGIVQNFAGFSNLVVLPETIQKRFNELDVFLQYSRDIGPITVTVGDIGFFINRDSETFVTLPNQPIPPIFIGTYGPFRTVGDEQFDRLFVRLATSKIPYIEPWITYYQTIYSEGQDQFHHQAFKQGPNPFGAFVYYNSFERSPEDYGGYLEGRLRGHFPITQWVDFNPFGVISYSFGDRSEPVTHPANFSEVIRGRPLRGWNVAQVGLELPIHLFHVVGHSSGPCAPPDFRLNLVPFMTYSYHISDPTAGTDRNEVFGGAKVAITF
jgi:hypothetical protein